MTLLDTNVLIYGFDSNSSFHSWAQSALREALLGSGAAVNPIILSELMVGDRQPSTVVDRLEVLGVHLLDLPYGSAHRCTVAYQRYLQNRRESDEISHSKLPLPDFFIGAHASVLDVPLATADTGRYETYFPEVKLVIP